MRVRLQADQTTRPGAAGHGRRRTRIALGAAAVPVLVVVLAQAILPSLAGDRVRTKVARYGHVESASVSAWPAVELLWGKADSAKVKASSLAFAPAQIAALLWEAKGVGSMTVSARHVTLQVAGLPDGLTVEDVTMYKHGSEVKAKATLTQAQLDAALPSGFRVQPTASGPEGIQVRASGGLFGATASLQALVSVVGGRLVAEPRGVPFAGLAAVTLFADPHLYVRSIGLSVLSRQPLVYGLSLVATLS